MNSKDTASHCWRLMHIYNPLSQLEVVIARGNELVQKTSYKLRVEILNSQLDWLLVATKVLMN